MLHIRPASMEDLPVLNQLYDGIIDRFREQTGKPGWKKGVYPTEGYFREAIKAGTMYVGELEGQLAAGMVLKQGMDESYQGAPWLVDAADSEVAVIHTLGVHPGMGGKGLGLEMARGAVAMARERSWKSVRLDVLDGNLPALRLYERAGFRYITTKKIWYEDTGLADFLLYEYPVEQEQKKRK